MDIGGAGPTLVVAVALDGDDQVSATLGDIGTKGEKSAAKVAAAFQQTTQSAQHLQQQLDVLTQGMNAWDQMNAKQQNAFEGMAAAIQSGGRMAEATTAQFQQLAEVQGFLSGSANQAATAVTAVGAAITQVTDSTRAMTLTQMQAIEADTAFNGAFIETRSVLAAHQAALDIVAQSTRALGLAEAEAAAMNDVFNGKFIESRAIVLAHAQALEIDAAAAAEQTAAMDLSGVGLGRLRQSFATLGAEALGIPTIFGRIGSTMASAFGVGSVVVIGVLAGVTAISYAWKALEDDADKLADKVTAAMKKVHDAAMDAQLATGDLQLAQAQKAVDVAQKAYDDAQAAAAKRPTPQPGALNGGFIAGSDAGADVAGLQTALAKAIEELQHWQQQKSGIERQSLLESRQTDAQALAERIQAGNATTDELKHANDEYAQYIAEAAQLAKTQTDNILRDADLRNAATLRQALNPTTPTADDSKLTGFADQIARLEQESQSFGKDASIQNRIQGIDDQLDQFVTTMQHQVATGKLSEDSFDKQAAAVEALRQSLYSAGADMQAAFDSQTTKKIDDQYAASKQLFDSLVDGAGAYGQLTAAKRAQKEIDQDALTLGHALSDADQQRIRDTETLNDAISDAKSIQAMRDRIVALGAEAAAIQSGESTRVTYAADLDLQQQLVHAATITDSALRNSYILTATSLNAMAGLLDGVKASTAALANEQKRDAELSASFAEANQKVADSLTKDMLGAVQQFATSGVTSFASFVSQAESLSTRLTEQWDSAVTDMTRKWQSALEAGDYDLADSIGKRIEALQKLAVVAEGVSVALSAASTGYQIGQSTGNTVYGVEGGAAAGALSGSAFGPAGAVVGGIVGAVTGFLGASKAQKEAADKLQAAAAAMQTSLGSYADSPNSMAQTLDQLYQQFVALWLQTNSLRSSGAISQTDYENQHATEKDTYDTLYHNTKDDFFAGITNALNATKGAAGDYANQLAAIEKSYTDSIASAQALSATQDQLNQIEALRTAQEKQLADTETERLTVSLANLSATFLTLTGQTDAAATAQLAEQQRQDRNSLVAAGGTPEEIQLQAINQVLARGQLEAQQQIQHQTDTLNAQLKTQQDALSVAQSSLQSLQQAAESLATFDQSLNTGSLSPLSPLDQLNAAKAQRDSLFGAAEGGDATAASQYAAAAQTVLQLSQAYNASGVGYQSDYATTKQQSDELSAQYAHQASLQQQTVDGLNSAIALAQSQLATLQDGNTLTQLTSADAIAELQSDRAATDADYAKQIAAVEQQESVASASLAVLQAQKQATDDNFTTQIDTQTALFGANSSIVQQLTDQKSAFDTESGKQIDTLKDKLGDDSKIVTNLQALQGQYDTKIQNQIDAITDTKTAVQQVGQDTATHLATLLRVPAYVPTDGHTAPGSILGYGGGYAAGGDFSGGLRLVGELGPELEATGPSRITNTGTLLSALTSGSGNAELVAEIRALRDEMRTGLQSMNRTGATGTKRTLARLDALIGKTDDQTKVTRRGLDRAASGGRK